MVVSARRAVDRRQRRVHAHPPSGLGPVLSGRAHRCARKGPRYRQHPCCQYPSPASKVDPSLRGRVRSHRERPSGRPRLPSRARRPRARDLRARQALRRPRRRRRARPRRPPRPGDRGPRARTARARRRRSSAARACGSPTAAACACWASTRSTQARDLRPRVGVMLQDGGLPTGVQAHEMLAHVARMYADPRDLGELTERLGLRVVRPHHRPAALRRAAAAARARGGDRRPARGRVPRRAQRRDGPADPARRLGPGARAARRGRRRRAHHAPHGRGGGPRRPGRRRRPRPRHRARLACRRSSPRPRTGPCGSRPRPGSTCTLRSARASSSPSRATASYTVTGAVDPDAVAARHRLARRAGRAGDAADRRTPHPRGRLPRPDRTEPAMSAPGRPPAGALLAQTSFEARAILRNGEQLLVTIIVPVLVLVGLDAGHRDRARHRRRQPDRLPDARHPRAGGDDDVVHVAGDRLVVRPPQRRPAAAVDHPAGPRRAARGQGARRPRRGGRAGRRHRPDRAAARLAPGPRRAALLAVVAIVARAPPRSPSLALLVAGTLRAEAVLAVANLLLLVLLAVGGRRRHPGEQLPGPMAHVALLLPSGALGEAMRETLLHGVAARRGRSWSSWAGPPRSGGARAACSAGTDRYRGPMDAAQDASFQAALAAEYAALVRTVAEFDGRLVTVKSWSVTLSLAGIGLGFQQAALLAVRSRRRDGRGVLADRGDDEAPPGAVLPPDAADRGVVRRLEHPPSRRRAGLRAPHRRRLDGAGRADPAAALDEPPREMTSDEIRRMRRNVAWLPHVFVPSAFAVVLGLALTVAAAAGGLDIPL